MDEIKSLHDEQHEEKKSMSNGNGHNGTVTWRWIAVASMAALTTVGGYLYKRMDDKVERILVSQMEVQKYSIETRERQNGMIQWVTEHKQEHKEKKP